MFANDSLFVLMQVVVSRQKEIFNCSWTANTDGSHCMKLKMKCSRSLFFHKHLFTLHTIVNCSRSFFLYTKAVDGFWDRQARGAPTPVVTLTLSINLQNNLLPNTAWKWKLNGLGGGLTGLDNSANVAPKVKQYDKNVNLQFEELFLSRVVPLLIIANCPRFIKG